MNPSEEQWDKWRQLLWLPPGLVPLNAGTCSPALRPVFEKMILLRQKMAADPQEFIWGSSLPLIENSRAALAEFLVCAKDQLLMMPNVSFGMNTVLQSLDFSAGDEVVMTDQEYHHFEALWRRVQKIHDLKFKIVHLPFRFEKEGLTSADIVSAFRGEISQKTKFVMVSHVSFATGMILPVREICAAAREVGAVSIVDGAHAGGMIDVNIGEIGADYYCGTAHKWMMGPVGTGYLWVARDRRMELLPLVTSSTWEYDRKKLDVENPGCGTYWQRSMEYQGTQDRVAQMVLGECFDIMGGIGWENIRRKSEVLRDYLRFKVGNTGHELLSHGGELATALTTFRVPRVDKVKAERWFHRVASIELSFINLAGVGMAMRVSTAWFNSIKDVDALVGKLSVVRWDDLI